MAGDVVLAHPFLFHSRGMKHVGPPRIISNTEASLRQPMQLTRPDPADHSILEQSIIAALQQPPPASGSADMLLLMNGQLTNRPPTPRRAGCRVPAG